MINELQSSSQNVISTMDGNKNQVAKCYSDTKNILKKFENIADSISSIDGLCSEVSNSITNQEAVFKSISENSSAMQELSQQTIYSTQLTVNSCETISTCVKDLHEQINYFDKK